MSIPDTSNSDQYRRETDRILMDIEDMIIKEEDAHQRAFLVVLNSINTSLVTNTRTVHDIQRKLETHLKNFENHTSNEEAIMNKGRGAWNILAWVLSIAQIVVIGAYVNVTSEIRNINTQIQNHLVNSKEVETRVDSMESVIKLIKSAE